MTRHRVIQISNSYHESSFWSLTIVDILALDATTASRSAGYAASAGRA
jgi:hypothetical protein